MSKLIGSELKNIPWVIHAVTTLIISSPKMIRATVMWPSIGYVFVIMLHLDFYPPSISARNPPRSYLLGKNFPSLVFPHTSNIAQ